MSSDYHSVANTGGPWRHHDVAHGEGPSRYHDVVTADREPLHQCRSATAPSRILI